MLPRATAPTGFAGAKVGAARARGYGSRAAAPRASGAIHWIGEPTFSPCNAAALPPFTAISKQPDEPGTATNRPGPAA